MVVVCEPITVQLDSWLPPEHWSWYSVITPFGVAGAFQVNRKDIECFCDTLNPRGAVSGPI